MTTNSIALPPVFDRAAAAGLLEQFRAQAADGTLMIDGSQVTRVGQAGLQLLLSAARTAAAANTPFWIVEPSDALVGAAALAGLDEALALDAAF